MENLNLDRASLYTDFNGLSDLKRGARENSKAALNGVAQQFEAIFVQMMLKSMRDASQVEGILDSRDGDMYRDMYDKQLSNSLSSQNGGIGLAEVIVRQLQQGQPQTASEESDVDASQVATLTLPERQLWRAKKELPHPAANDSLAAVALQMQAAIARLDKAERNADSSETAESSRASEKSLAQERRQEIDQFDTPEAFIDQLRPYAERAGKRLGVNPDVLLAQAALETGWGRKVIRRSDGENSHNLFNIKADNGWEGPAIAKQTLEFKGGIARQEVAAFRSYDSYAESFNDYVHFLQNNPRYQEALEKSGDSGQYLRQLHRAGYATDPNYVSKIESILNSDTLQAV
ncbi:MAG: flagellar assembly peptidoglycan hydrolase FlgJ [Gammaproteobacteria bacterium]|nr:flagellar assembly peptidoglycan hydrolase FlgJ [Gammaproteobacteria bacterium]